MLEFGYVDYRRIMRQLLSSLVFVGCTVPAIACEVSAPLEFTNVAAGVYVHEGVHEDISEHNCGDIANVGFIVGNTSVAVIDPGGSPAIGRQIVNAVRRVTSLPISHVIITHFHPDHLLGGFQVSEGVAVVAHKNYLRAQTQRGQFYLDRYSILFSASDAVQLAPPTVEVKNQNGY